MWAKLTIRTTVWKYQPLIRHLECINCIENVFSMKTFTHLCYLVTLFCVPNSESLKIGIAWLKLAHMLLKNNLFNHFSTVEFLFPITEIEEIILL